MIKKEMGKVINTVFFFLLVFPDHGFTYKECSPSEERCEYWLVIEERLTMHWDKTRVYAKNGTLYRHDEGPDNHKTQVPIDEVITMDGFERGVVAVNNSIPGPPIIVYEGQSVIVHVTNHLLSEAVTIHWHGMHQKGTSYSDGVAFISQCPIDSGQKFTYTFNATPHGTYFYHSHIGGQRLDGLFGALIVKPRKQEANPPEDVIMHVGDWLHDRGSELHAKMIYGNFKTQPGFTQPETLDGVKFAPTIWKSGYIEGRGRYLDPNTETWTESPLKVYTVDKNKRYRFRVIGAGMIFPLRVSIDGHVLEMVSSDGYDFKPVMVESFIVNPGERFDFIVQANQTVGNYWIRVQSMESNFDHYVKGIFRYSGAPATDPVSVRINCTAENVCIVMNCPFLEFPDQDNTRCIQINDLSSVESAENTPLFEDADEEHIFNFVAGDGRMVINGNIFEHPSVSSFTQPDDIRKGLKCEESCEADKNCNCYFELEVPYGKTIQMVWTNHGKGAIRHHPIHLHGHAFHVLKIGYGKYNKTTGLLLHENKDIDCGQTPKNYCNHPKWKNSSWHGDNVPGIRTKDAPQKDTLMVPAGAYAVVRFKSDNPGKWFLHCHIEFHSMQGMAMVINEAPSRHIPPPVGFPVCMGFHENENLNLDYIKREKEEIKASKTTCKNEQWRFWAYVAYALIAVVLIETFVLFFTCYFKKEKQIRKIGVSHEMNHLPPYK